MKRSQHIVYMLSAGVILALGAVTLPALTHIVTPTASAQSSSASKAIVDAAKKTGTVGERADGYLGVVGNASAAVQAAVNEINILRKSAYTRLASQQNVSTEVIATLSGESLFAKTPRGQKIMNKSGQWVTK